MAKIGQKFLNFIGLGGDDEDDEEEEYYEEDEAPVRRQTKARASKQQEPEFDEDEEFIPERQPREAQPARQQVQPQTAARRTSSSSGQRIQTAQGVGLPTTSSAKMIVYHPVSYEDTQNIVHSMNSGKPVIVNMEELETDTAQRILDFLSGAVFAVDGSMSKISRGIFIVAPKGCSVISNDEQETPDL